MGTAEDRGQPSNPSSGIGTMDIAADGGQPRTPTAIANWVQNEAKITGKFALFFSNQSLLCYI